MKTLFVLNYFLPSQIAGTEIYALALARELRIMGVDTDFIVPGYGFKESYSYISEGFLVKQYAEPSVVDRSLQMGFRKPDGLSEFVIKLTESDAEIVHFHEMAGSNGISIHHVKEAKRLGKKVLMTFHLSRYSCMTGTLVRNGKLPCDGKIELEKCTTCYLCSKGLNASGVSLLSRISMFLHTLKVDTTKLLSNLGTALGTSYLVDRKHAGLHELVSYCDKVIVLADWYRNILIDNGIPHDKIKLISQGLPISVMSIITRKLPSSKLKFIFVGRLSHFKGLHLLVEAFTHVDPNKAELNIYGQTDDLQFEKKLKDQTILSSNIFWRGAIAPSHVIEIMSDHDVLCLCSTFSEMSPLVIQEAFAAGIPLIASNVYGNAAQVKHGVNGLLFDFNDPEDLKTQITKCIEDPDLLLHLKKGISTSRSFSEVASEHIQLYNTIIN